MIGASSRPRAARRVRIVLTLAVLVAGGTPAPARAQLQRPFQGLFGQRPGGDRPQSLDLTASLFAGYDDDIFARGSGARNRGRRIGGTFVGGQTALAYERRQPTSQLSASLASAYRWVTTTDTFVPTFYGLRLSYGKSFTPRTTMVLSQRVTYRPFFSVVPFPVSSSIDEPLQGDDTDPAMAPLLGDFGSEGPDDITLGASRTAVIYNGGASLRRELTPRSSLLFAASYGLADFQSSALNDVNNRRLQGAFRYSYNFTQYASLRLGYGYRTFRTRLGETNENHDIDIGMRYGRPFTFGTGRTTFSMTTGSTMLVRERLDGVNGSGDRVLVRLLGTATLRHDFIAPWQAQAVYVRSVAFLDGLSEPFEGDRIVASLGGFLNRRTDVMASAGYVSGSFGMSRRNFSTALANARIRTSLTPNVSLFAQYFYFQYDFSSSLADRLVVAPHLERQGLRGGLTVWLPLTR